MGDVFGVVITGVSVFVFGQIIVKFLVEPVLRQRRVIGRIAFSLVYYACDFGNPGIGTRKRLDEASVELRRLASDLRAETQGIPFYGFWSQMRLVRGESAVLSGVGDLIQLSNSVHAGDGATNLETRRKLEDRLGITSVE